MNGALNCERRQKGESLAGGRPVKGIVRGAGEKEHTRGVAWATSEGGEAGDTRCKKAGLFIMRRGPSSCLNFVSREEELTKLLELSSDTVKA